MVLEYEGLSSKVLIYSEYHQLSAVAKTAEKEKVFFILNVKPSGAPALNMNVRGLPQSAFWQVIKDNCVAWTF